MNALQMKSTKTNGSNDLSLLFAQLQETSEAIRAELEARIKVLNEAALVSETDRFGTIIFANDLFCQVAGYERQELIGKPHNIVRHPDMPSEVFKEMWQTIKAGKVFKGIVKNRKKNGDAYWVQATIVPVLGIDGKPIKYIGVRFDITEQIQQQEEINQLLTAAEEDNQALQQHQEELQQNLEEINAIQEQLEERYRESEAMRNELNARVNVLNESALVSETDKYGTITFVNDLFCIVSGYTREELLGKPHNIVRHPDTPRHFFEELWQTIKSGNIFQGTIKNRRKDGTAYWVQVTIAPVLDENGKPIKYIGVRFDITEQVQQQESIKAMLKEAQQMNEELRQNREELKQKKQITDSINYAKRIQEALLPHEDVMYNRFPHSFVLYKPKDIVSGDFYWFHSEKKYTAIAAIDCTGHGVPGAFMSVMANSLLNEIVVEKKIISPDLILNQLQEKVIRTLRQTETDGQSHDGMDIAICVIDNKNLVLAFAGANRPLYWVRNGVLEEVKGNKMPIGGARFLGKTFEKHVISLEPQDRIYLASDGYQDQFGGEENRKFSSKRLKELIVQQQHIPMNQQGNVFGNTINEWLGQNKQIDDILLIGFEV
jgi:PAS domain S-box-containing protein